MYKPSSSLNNGERSSSSSSRKPLQFNEAAYQSLLVIAENCRIAQPPRVRMSIHCLMSVFNLNPPPPVQLRTHLQLGSLLLKYTENVELARLHLQAAVTLAKNQGDSPSHFEAISLLSIVLCKLSKPSEAKPLLREGIAASQHSPHWHSRLLLQLACLHHEEHDHVSTCQLLDLGADLASNCGSNYLRILLLLSKGMVLLVEKNLTEVNTVLSMCGQLIDSIQNASSVQVECLKIFFLTLQVAHLLSGGQVKSVKSSLKQLQQSVQDISSLPASACCLVPPDESGKLKEIPEIETMMEKLTSTDAFSWLPRDQMCTLVYLVTVTHSMLAGYLDKAEKCSTKALNQINKFKATDKSPLLLQLELMLLEHMAQCHLVNCDKQAALQKITQCCRICVSHPFVSSITRHTTQLHTLLGMYCMSMNYIEMAEKHLQIAAEKSKSNEQFVTNMLNLAMVYMHSFQMHNGRIPHVKQELMQILSHINPDAVTFKSRNLKAASYFVKGMFSFLQASYSDAKRFLRETLKMANAQDLNRLTACGLVLLAHIYMSIGNRDESITMAIPAMQLANKIPDVTVKLWAAALLCDLYRLQGDNEKYMEYANLVNQLSKERLLSCETTQPKIIKWLKDDLPTPEMIDDVQDTVLEQMDTSENLQNEWLMDERPTSKLNEPHCSSTATMNLLNHSDSSQVTPSLQTLSRGHMNTGNGKSHVKVEKEVAAKFVQHHPQQSVPHGLSVTGDYSVVPPVNPMGKDLKMQKFQHNPTHNSEYKSMLPYGGKSTEKGLMLAESESSIEKMQEMSSSTAQRSMVQSSLKVTPETAPSAHVGMQSNSRQMVHTNAYQTNVGHFPTHEPPVSYSGQHVDHYGKFSAPSEFYKSGASGKVHPEALLPQDHHQLSKLSAGGPGYMGIGDVGQYSNISTQHQIRQQALLQQHLQQVGHLFPQSDVNNLQHAYNQEATGLISQHPMGIGFPFGSKIQIPQGLNLQQQQAWTSNQNNIYNSNNENYSWR